MKKVPTWHIHLVATQPNCQRRSGYPITSCDCPEHLTIEEREVIAEMIFAISNWNWYERQSSPSRKEVAFRLIADWFLPRIACGMCLQVQGIRGRGFYGSVHRFCLAFRDEIRKSPGSPGSEPGHSRRAYLRESFPPDQRGESFFFCGLQGNFLWSASHPVPCGKGFRRVSVFQSPFFLQVRFEVAHHQNGATRELPTVEM